MKKKTLNKILATATTIPLLWLSGCGNNTQQIDIKYEEQIPIIQVQERENFVDTFEKLSQTAEEETSFSVSTADKKNTIAFNKICESENGCFGQIQSYEKLKKGEDKEVQLTFQVQNSNNEKSCEIKTYEEENNGNYQAIYSTWKCDIGDDNKVYLNDLDYISRFSDLGELEIEPEKIAEHKQLILEKLDKLNDSQYLPENLTKIARLKGLIGKIQGFQRFEDTDVQNLNNFNEYYQKGVEEENSFYASGARMMGISNLERLELQAYENLLRLQLDTIYNLNEDESLYKSISLDKTENNTTLSINGRSKIKEYYGNNEYSISEGNFFYGTEAEEIFSETQGNRIFPIGNQTIIIDPITGEPYYFKTNGISTHYSPIYSNWDLINQVENNELKTIENLQNYIAK